MGIKKPMHGDYKKALLKHSDKLLSAVLGVVAIHSLGIGLTLIAQPAILMEFAGFSPDCEYFFLLSAVFFILSCSLYILWERSILRNIVILLYFQFL
jgi:hypothetical protein